MSLKNHTRRAKHDYRIVPENSKNADPLVLSDVKLLAIVSGSNPCCERTHALCQSLLAKHSLLSLSRATVEELRDDFGVDSQMACRIGASFELARRALFYPVKENEKITGPRDVVTLMMPKMGRLEKEHFVVLSLDPVNGLLSADIISVGSADENAIRSSQVFKSPISQLATSVIFVHNHPSGDPSPSEDDLKVTRRMKQNGDLLGIAVLDHIIIGDGKWISMKELGLL